MANTEICLGKRDEFLEFYLGFCTKNRRNPNIYEISDAGHSDVYKHFFDSNPSHVRKELGLTTREEMKILGYTNGIGKLEKNMETGKVLEIMKRIFDNCVEYKKRSDTTEEDREDIIQEAFIQFLGNQRKHTSGKDKNYDLYMRKCLAGIILNLVDKWPVPTEEDQWWYKDLILSKKTSSEIDFEERLCMALNSALSSLPEREFSIIEKYYDFNRNNLTTEPVDRSEILKYVESKYGPLSDVPEHLLESFGIIKTVEKGRKHGDVVSFKFTDNIDLGKTRQLAWKYDVTPVRISQLRQRALFRLRRTLYTRGELRHIRI
jgi:RNA polymerase sigma factor (sigma-70 family)